MSDQWGRLKGQVRRAEDLIFDYRKTSIPGTWVLEAYVDDFAVPIGSVWWRYVGNKMIEIMHSYVWSELRRCGLRTRMHDRMREHYPGYIFITCEGNAKSEPWLQKMGFEKDPLTKDWRLRPMEVEHAVEDTK